MSPSNSVRRARPLLGTVVDIRVDAAPGAATTAAIESGFAAVARVGRLMSIHAPDSEVSRLNRHGHEQAMAVDPWTYDVLAAANRIWVASGGLFDCTVAPVLARYGFLPRDTAPSATAAATQGDVVLLDDCRVHFRHPLSLDVGGIAKGFAVDRAVAAMQARGIEAGAVNAGGDLRVFGPAPQPIHLRNPACPGQFVEAGCLRAGAVATSAAYFARRRSDGRWLSPIVDPRRGQPLAADGLSVSVIAPDALTADALTKPVAMAGALAADLLTHFGACAVILDAENQFHRIGHPA